MSGIILDGEKVAEEIKEKLKGEINRLDKKPGLAAVLIGNDFSSKLYVEKKEGACKELGIHLERYDLKEDIDEKEVVELIERLNDDDKINGVLVQLPLPKNLDTKNILEKIDPGKDVDGLTSVNMGRLVSGDEVGAICTPKGIIRLLDKYEIDIKGKNVVIINHSNIVGKPLNAMMLNREATVTVCHEFTKNLIEYTKNADILITGVGIADFIKEDMVKGGGVIIDVGISKKGDKVVGDVDFENVKEKTSYITPVPGGVGPMTIAMLMENTLEAYKLQR